MTRDSDPWKIADEEWDALGPLLVPDPQLPRARGRPRVEDVRSIAEACLFRSYHCLSTERCHSFGWNLLPPDFGISGSTPTRRFREWNASGAWSDFWAGLLRLRGPEKRLRPRRARKSGPYPVSGLLGELERAYHFFNEVL